MTKIQWEKASLCQPDPARMQQTTDIMAPDSIVITVVELTPKEKRRLEKIELRRAEFRAAIKREENRRKEKRRTRRKAIFNEDAEREARLRLESEVRRSKKDPQ